METSGEVSVFYYEDHEVQPGLPILPFLFKLKVKQSQQKVFIPVPFVAIQKATNQEMPYATFVQNLNGSNQ
jgi:hypothetical protein